MDENITDQATATAALNKARDQLAKAVVNADKATAALRDGIVQMRPLGTITVDEMAVAICRDRNYIDSVWSAYGDTQKGKQTRVAAADLTEDELSDAFNRLRAQLVSLAHNQRGAANTVPVIRSERDRVVSMVYASKILGPTAIAAAVGVDRNHVLRIARKSKVAPVWRQNAKNQYTSK